MRRPPSLPLPILLPALVLTAALAALAAPAAAESWPHERDGFVIGFNVGAGTATARPDVGDDSDGGGGAASFRLGWGLANQFLLGYESTAWKGDVDPEGDLTLVTHKLNFTWYPGATGWFLRAGFGAGTAEVSSDLFGPTISVEESGGAFGLGAGHEWRLTRRFALGAAVDYNRIDLDEGDFDYVNFTAQLNWYF